MLELVQHQRVSGEPRWIERTFRFTPGRASVTYALIAVTAIAAASGVAWALSRRAWELSLYSTGAVVSCFAFWGTWLVISSVSHTFGIGGSTTRGAAANAANAAPSATVH